MTSHARDERGARGVGRERAGRRRGRRRALPGGRRLRTKKGMTARAVSAVGTVSSERVVDEREEALLGAHRLRTIGPKVGADGTGPSARRHVCISTTTSTGHGPSSALGLRGRGSRRARARAGVGAPARHVAEGRVSRGSAGVVALKVPRGGDKRRCASSFCGRGERGPSPGAAVARPSAHWARARRRSDDVQPSRRPAGGVAEPHGEPLPHAPPSPICWTRNRRPGTGARLGEVRVPAPGVYNARADFADDVTGVLQRGRRCRARSSSSPWRVWRRRVRPRRRPRVAAQPAAQAVEGELRQRAAVGRGLPWRVRRRARSRAARSSDHQVELTAPSSTRRPVGRYVAEAGKWKPPAQPRHSARW